MASGPSALGVVYDVDGVLQLASRRRQLGRLRALLMPTPRDRRSLLAMPHLLRSLSTELSGCPVFYLTGLPIRIARPMTGALARDGYPSGTLVATGRLLAPWWLLGSSRKRKLAAVESIADRWPRLSWVLIGDDADHAADVFTRFTERRPEGVAVIALRQALDVERLQIDVGALSRRAPDVAVVAAPNGEELLPLLRTSVGLEPPRGGAVQDWFLTGEERGNATTQLQAWTEGNDASPIVHGRAYLSVLANTLAAAGRGDLVLQLGWREDADELLDDRGPTAADALTAAARRGVAVRGLLWHSHMALVRYHTAENLKLAQAVAAAGGEVLLDQRVRGLGSHHQKMVVVRHPSRPRADVAFLGGIDVDHGGRDDADHSGDPQSVGAYPGYGPTPAYHDVQLQLHGPAVQELDRVFRERWDDPAALSRLPWQVLADRFHGLRRTATPLPAPLPEPPPAGTCAVQILRTYPARRPRYPFAPLGERSVARAYIKALSRVERLVYVEDQYLWSFDVARIFAAALQRAPRLRLIAVVPRRPDDQNPLYLGPATLGHSEAMAMVRESGGDRVQILDVTNPEGKPVYVHSKLCIADDVWAVVGSANFNRRSWTYDSELAAAVLDDERDPRPPTDPGGLGDGARRFARELRLTLLREHLGVDDDVGLLDPDDAAETIRRSADRLESWYMTGRHGPRPPGRLRPHTSGPEMNPLPPRHRWFTAPLYRAFLDPDGRPLGMRLRRAY